MTKWAHHANSPVACRARSRGQSSLCSGFKTADTCGQISARSFSTKYSVLSEDAILIGIACHVLAIVFKNILIDITYVGSSKLIENVDSNNRRQWSATCSWKTQHMLVRNKLHHEKKFHFQLSHVYLSIFFYVLEHLLSFLAHIFLVLFYAADFISETFNLI